MPTGAASTVNALRSGNLYRDSATASPDWASTALAAEILADLGGPLPRQVSNDAASRASTLAATMDVKQIDEAGLPILEVLAASRPSAALRQLLPQMAVLLSSWSASLEATGASPVSVGDLADIHQIAQQAGVRVSGVPAAFLAPLRAPDGYYGLGTHASAGDPQMTYQAVELGAAFTATARATLALGHLANGWLASESAPPPSTPIRRMSSTSCAGRSHRARSTPNC